MRAKAVSSIWAHPERLERASRYWDRGSRLLLSLQPHLPKVRAMVVRLNEPTLGSMWTNCSIRQSCREHEQFEKGLCVYLNSTVGVLTMLGGFTRGEGLKRRRPKMEEWNILTVPDFSRVDGAMRILAEAFDEFGEHALSPLPESDTCPVRLAIDHAVCEALGTSEKLTREIRRLIVAEPSVTLGAGTKRKLSEAERQQPLFELC